MHGIQAGGESTLQFWYGCPRGVKSDRRLVAPQPRRCRRMAAPAEATAPPPQKCRNVPPGAICWIRSNSTRLAVITGSPRFAAVR